MTEDPHSDQHDRPRSRRKLWTALAVVTVIAILIVVPPLIGINQYKSRITQLVAASLDRPVRLSGVELRLLPRPGFVITDLTVQEDPAYSAEPVLHANTVVADIRLWSLWRGQLRISRISVDEASLNLVRTADGRWNVDALFQTAAGHRHAASGGSLPLPYMEATNSRINVKNGTEKLPFSLLSADASLWQESNGDWRVRLRGQPVRTDVSLDMADTGILRLEGTLRPAPRLDQMPLHLDLDWEDAQLGQLSRLLLGSDQGWRGDLRGELHLDGTVESAQVRSRLRAAGVHRAEFAPAAPLDFDATCSFAFRSATRGLQNLVCDSPVGDGRAKLTGDLPGRGGSPNVSLELNQVPAQAGLDLLRTLRSDLDAGLQAAGTVSGKVTYNPAAAPVAEILAAKAAGIGKKKHAATPPVPVSPLTGALTVVGLNISGGALTTPVQIGKLTLQPAPGNTPALTMTAPIPAGAPIPLTLTAQMALHGFQVQIHGSASLPRLRELAQAAGFAQVQALAQIGGEPPALDLSAQGAWLPEVAPNPGTGTGSMTGTLTLHDANWRADFLAGPVLIPEATLHIENGSLRWDPAAFALGPVKGTATLELPPACDTASGSNPGANEDLNPDATPLCAPRFTVHFASLDAAALQAALLGAQQRDTLLSSLLARLSSSAARQWPRLDGAVQADTLLLGPFRLQGLTADLTLRPSGAEITSFHAEALGGALSGSARLTLGDKPAYQVEGSFSNLNPPKVGQLFGMKWGGGSLDGDGKVDLSGYSAGDLASSAAGTLHFDWQHGTVASIIGAPVPAALAKFDRWTADAKIANGRITLQQNYILRGTKTSSVQGAADFGIPAAVSFDAQSAHSAKAASR